MFIELKVILTSFGINLRLYPNKLFSERTDEILKDIYSLE